MKSSKLVVANHKMNMTSIDINQYLKKIKKEINVENVIICPTSIYIPYFLKHNFKVGIQNVFYENKGAYTGEISPRQAKSMEIDYAIVGHSERRNYFLETNQEINKKVRLCLKNNLKVILCIGETKEEKRNRKTEEVLEKEIIENLEGVKNFKDIIIAYEPIWAIGSKKTPTMKEIDISIRFIKQIMRKHYHVDNIQVIYGGSVSEENVQEIATIPTLDGVLVGGASIKEEFINIAKTILKADKNEQNSTNIPKTR